MNPRIIALLFVLPALCAQAEDAEARRTAFLGVRLERISPALQSQLGIADGVLVVTVVKDSPAARVGLKPHDIITSIDGETVMTLEDVVTRIHGRDVGEQLRLQGRSGGEPFDLEVTLGERPEQGDPPPPPRDEPGFLGVGYGQVPELLAAHLMLEPGDGVVVGDVLAGSAAAVAGIDRYDVIVAVDGHPVRGPEDFVEKMAGKRAGATAELELIHRGEARTVNATLQKRPPQLRRHHWLRPKSFMRRYRWPGPWQWHEGTPFDPEESFFRGRMRFRGPDGEEQVLELPDGFRNLADLTQEIEAELQRLTSGATLPDLRTRLQNLLEDSGDPDDLDWTWSGNNMILERRQGGYEIVVRSEDGKRTATVKKGSEVVAEDLPENEWGSLPDAVRTQVEAMVKRMRTHEVDRPRGASRHEI